MVKAKCRWQKTGLQFNGEAGGFSVALDGNPSETAASEGSFGPTPKQVALVSIAGCSAMDVVSLLQKNKQAVSEFWIDCETDTTARHPKVFTDVQLSYHISGQVETSQAVEAVRLSMTRYCGVSAMFSKAVAIHYKVILNGADIYQDLAKFD